MTDIKRKIWTLIRGGSFKGYLRTVSGYPLTLTDCMAVQPVSLAVSGNAVQNGTPSQDNPVEVRGVREQTANGYKVPLKFSGKNLFDAKTASVVNGVVDANTLVYVNYGIGKYTYIKCLPNKTYVISKLPQGGVYCTSDNPPSSGKKCNKRLTTVEDNITTSTAIITTGDNDTYIWIALVPTTGGVYTAEEMIDSIQIEQGDTATPYEPYHEPQTYPFYLDTPLYGNSNAADTVELDVEHKRATLIRRWKVFQKITPYKRDTSNGYNCYLFSHRIPYIKSNNRGYCSHLKYEYSNAYNNNHFFVSSSNIEFYMLEDIDIQAFCSEAVFILPLPTPQAEDISDKIDWDSIPKLWRGTVIITADTEIEPTSIAVEYYADKPGGGD